MGLATEARRLLERMPAPAREALESTIAFVPRPFLYGRTFRAVQAGLARSERWSAERMRADQDRRVCDLVAWAYARSPFYRTAMDTRGVRPEHVQGTADLKLLPLIDKGTLREHGESMLARGVPASAREQVSTGGTSGEPLRFWIDRGRSATEWAFMTWQWRRVGYRPGASRAVLRGVLVGGEDPRDIAAWRPLLDELALSTFKLTPETLPLYLAAIARRKPSFLHAYPSSAEHFARLCADLPATERPRFRAILLGSETVYPAQRAYLEKAYGATVFAWYGHSEKCLLGGGCERSTDAHLFPEYGALEVVDDAGQPVAPGGRGTLVGTGFMNRVMPFLRYATDDRATLVEEPCACGRPYPRVRDIVGRWHDDYLYGDGGRRFTMTALNTHGAAFDRVLRFRIRQERPGEAEVLVVPAPSFGEPDARAIVDEYTKRASGTVRFSVRVEPDLPLTGRGKFRFIEQLIPADTQAALDHGAEEDA
jgi:phenylacetate-CoA ligase